MNHGTLPAVQLAHNEVIVTGPACQIVLPDGSPLRMAGCLVCRKPIGGHTCDLVNLCPVNMRPAASGNVGGAAFLVHGDCPLPDTGALIDLAFRRITSDATAPDLTVWVP